MAPCVPMPPRALSLHAVAFHGNERSPRPRPPRLTLCPPQPTPSTLNNQATLRLYNMNSVLSNCEGLMLTAFESALAPVWLWLRRLRAAPRVRLPVDRASPCHPLFTAPLPAASSAGGELAPTKESLLTQQGGCIGFDGQKTIFRHADSGALEQRGRPAREHATRLPASLGACCAAALPFGPPCACLPSSLPPFLPPFP